ncbi:MAG: hypothetical protein V4603_02985, partial [Pseudomonadota bacterium]
MDISKWSALSLRHKRQKASWVVDHDVLQHGIVNTGTLNQQGNIFSSTGNVTVADNLVLAAGNGGSGNLSVAGNT